MTAGFRLEGIQGSMVAHVGHTCESGRHCALVVLVCSEAFPEGLLDGAVFHWAVASREGGTWSPPPDGWQSDPSRTIAAGMIFVPVAHCLKQVSSHLCLSQMLAGCLRLPCVECKQSIDPGHSWGFGMCRTHITE